MDIRDVQAIDVHAHLGDYITKEGGIRCKWKSGDVDVVLQRTRQKIRDCMRRRGFTAQDMPPGTFVDLLHSFRLEGQQVVAKS